MMRSLIFVDNGNIHFGYKEKSPSKIPKKETICSECQSIHGNHSKYCSRYNVFSKTKNSRTGR